MVNFIGLDLILLFRIYRKLIHDKYKPIPFYEIKFEILHYMLPNKELEYNQDVYIMLNILKLMYFLMLIKQLLMIYLI